MQEIVENEVVSLKNKKYTQNIYLKTHIKYSETAENRAIEENLHSLAIIS